MQLWRSQITASESLLKGTKPRPRQRPRNDTKPHPAKPHQTSQQFVNMPLFLCMEQQHKENWNMSAWTKIFWSSSWHWDFSSLCFSNVNYFKSFISFVLWHNWRFILLTHCAATLDWMWVIPSCTYLLRFLCKNTIYSRSYMSIVPGEFGYHDSELNTPYLYLHNVIWSSIEISPGARLEHIVQGEKQPLDFEVLR